MPVTTVDDVSNHDGSPVPVQGFGNNSAWVQAGSCLHTPEFQGPGIEELGPSRPSRDGSFYWPGAAVVVGSRFGYVFMQRLVVNGAFGSSVGAARSPSSTCRR